MAEWLKAHAWKACVPQGTVGSNPTLSASNPLYIPKHANVEAGFELTDRPRLAVVLFPLNRVLVCSRRAISVSITWIISVVSMVGLQAQEVGPVWRIRRYWLMPSLRSDNGLGMGVSVLL
jgi:hypothetical protein